MWLQGNISSTADFGGVGEELGRVKRVKGEFIRKMTGVLLLFFVISIGFSNEVKTWMNIPTNMTVFEGDHTPLAEAVQSLVSTSTKVSQKLDVEEGEMTVAVGGLPIKQIDVTSIPATQVVPGGQSIGVKLNTKGVLVVGHHTIQSKDGSTSPGEKVDIRVGDMIVKIDEKEITAMNEVEKHVQAAGNNGKNLVLEIKRNNERLVKELTPIKENGNDLYRMGLYIRDSAAGVGTLTFYDKSSKKYGALGHVISDVDTQKPIIVNDGEIVRSSVTSIEKGSNGDPGEKLANFTTKRDVLGTIEKNSPFGIFGKLQKEALTNKIHDEQMPITLSSQVKEGPAKILTVLEGEKVEQFDIEIISSVPQKKPATKGLVIKVTDPRLLEATGGIIQGMSGSPIIQNDKLVGAVTHVFVNDPTSGYGCHISWMLHEAGIPTKEIDELAEAS